MTKGHQIFFQNYFIATHDKMYKSLKDLTIKYSKSLEDLWW